MKPFSKKFINKQAEVPERPRFMYDPEPYDQAEARGQKEISKFDPEYTFLVKLIKLVTSKGVPPQEVKALAEAFPFVTVADVGDLAAKIWTLATEKYGIPREFLLQNLPKNAGLKQADLWPAQEAAEDMVNHAPGYLSYEYGQDGKDTSVSGPNPNDVDKEADDEFTGAEFSTDDYGVNPTMDIGPWSSPEDHGAKPQKSPFPNTGWLPADDENKDEQPASNVASSLKRPFSKKANPDSRYWIAPDGTEFPVSGIHPAWIKNNFETLKKYGIDPTGKTLGDLHDEMINSGWVRVSNEPAGTGFNIEVRNVFSLPSFLDDFVAKNFNNGDTVVIGNPKSGGFATLTDPFPTLQKAVRKNLRNASLNKQASAYGYWVDPSGLKYETDDHDGWLVSNKKLLKDKYGITTIPTRSGRPDVERFAAKYGWVRVVIGSDILNKNTVYVFVPNTNSIPSFVDDILIEINKKMVAIDDINNNGGEIPFSDVIEYGIQKAFNKTRQRKRMGSLKQAAVDSQFVNQMLQSIHSNGGATYNPFKGDLNGTPNFSVAIYPDREQIVEGVDFDVLEGYVEANEDLLSDAKNSVGAWSNNGKVVLDVVVTVSDEAQAIELAKQHNQLAIWDLQNNKEIQTDNTNGVQKTADDQVLPQDQQDQIAAIASPTYNIALNNYAQAVKRGHEKQRSLDYAIQSVSNIEKIDPKKLVELINNYL